MTDSVPAIMYETELRLILALTNNIAFFKEKVENEGLSIHHAIALNRKASTLLSAIKSGKEVDKPLDIDGGLRVWSKEE